MIAPDAGFDEVRIEVFERSGGLFIRQGTTVEPLLFEVPLSAVNDVYEDMSLRARGANVRSRAQLNDPVRDIGVRLFTALSKTTPGRLFHERSARAERQGRGLRIRIAVSGPGGEQLPWELLCDPVTNSFLALARGIAVVRTVTPQEFVVVPPPLTGPVRVTVLTADVTGTLETKADVAMLRAVTERGGYQLTVHENVDVNGVFSALEQPADVLYFAGTGASSLGAPTYPRSQALAVFTPSKHRDAWDSLDGNALASAAARAGIRLAILAACHSDVVARQLAAVRIAASLGFRGLVGIPEMVSLTTALCRSLAAGDPFETAVCEARHGIDLGSPGSRQWALATAYLQAASGDLFGVEAPVASAVAVAAPPPPAPSKAADREWHALAKRKALYEQKLEMLKRRIDDQSVAGFAVPELQEERAALEARLAETITKMAAVSAVSS